MQCIHSVPGEWIHCSDGIRQSVDLPMTASIHQWNLFPESLRTTTSRSDFAHQVWQQFGAAEPSIMHSFGAKTANITHGFELVRRHSRLTSFASNTKTQKVQHASVVTKTRTQITTYSGIPYTTATNNFSVLFGSLFVSLGIPLTN